MKFIPENHKKSIQFQRYSKGTIIDGVRLDVLGSFEVNEANKSQDFEQPLFQMSDIHLQTVAYLQLR